MSEDDIICQITGEIFCDPVIAKDGQTYEREGIMKWIDENGTSPNNPNIQLEGPDLITNYAIKRVVDTFLKNNPQKKDDQYKPDNRHRQHYETVANLIEVEQFNDLGNYKEYDTADLIKRHLFSMILGDAPDWVIKIVLEEHIANDSWNIEKESAGWYIINYANATIVQYYLESFSGDILKLRKRGLHKLVRMVFSRGRDDEQLLRYICDNFEFDINNFDKNTGTLFAVLLQNSEYRFTDDFVTYFCDKFGKSIDWNKRSNSTNAIYHLFKKSNIGWSSIRIFLKSCNKNSLPDFTDYVGNSSSCSALYLLCKWKDTPKYVFKFLYKNYEKLTMEWSFINRHNGYISPFNKLCRNNKSLDVIAYVTEKWEIPICGYDMKFLLRNSNIDNERKNHLILKLLSIDPGQYSISMDRNESIKIEFV